MSVVVIIPARYKSTRFPGKPLANIAGKPLIQHVYERAKTALLVDRVIVATDSEMIFQRVLSFRGSAVMTSPDHPSGTDRIAEVARGTDYDIIVNVQGDEPLIRGEMIDDVVGLLKDKIADIGTLVKKIEDPGEIFNPNVVKAVFDREGFALYFSRAPVPFYREEFSELQVSGFRFQVSRQKSEHDAHNLQSATCNFELYKHIGIYSYRREVLLRLTGLPQSRLEKAERLEQLRALENGYKIKVKETESETIGVDTREDLERVEKWLDSSS